MAKQNNRNYFNYGSRREESREIRRRFLIVCEDGKTAPQYFRGFRLSSATVIPIGTGKNTLSLVNEAIHLKESEGFTGDTDEVWVVMDRDSFPKSNYDNAFTKASRQKINVIFCNECIEVWFVMHFSDSTSQIPRRKLPAQLSKYLGKRYEKGMREIYQLLLPRQNFALTASAKIKKLHYQSGSSELRHCSPATDIDRLVSSLNKFLR